MFNIFGAFFMKCQDRYHVISLSFFYKLFLISPYLSTSEEDLSLKKNCNRILIFSLKSIRIIWF